MQIIQDIQTLRECVRSYRSSGEEIGLVPTMGYLHEGHLSLVELMRKYCQRVVVSIFVNPRQFNNPDDLTKYPRDLERDYELLRSRDVDAVFVPDVKEIYPDGHQTSVSLSSLTKDLEGACRPGHFQGVTTIVSILFNLVTPDIAIFGEKDFQQLRVIESMVDDLKFDIKVVRGPLVREADGIAMSSRNVRLDTSAREQALALSRALLGSQKRFEDGERDAEALRREVEEELKGAAGVKVDYVRLVDENSLSDVKGEITENSRLLVAAEVGGVRLIDNVAFYP